MQLLIICLKYCVKYIYASILLKYKSEVLYSSISIFCYFILTFLYILKANTVFFTHYNYWMTVVTLQMSCCIRAKAAHTYVNYLMFQSENVIINVL